MALSNALKSAALQGAPTQDLLGIIAQEMGLPFQDVTSSSEAQNLIKSGYQGLIKLNGNVINPRSQPLLQNAQVVSMLDEAGQTQAKQFNQSYQNFGDGKVYSPSDFAKMAYERDIQDMKTGGQAAAQAEKADKFSTSGSSNMRGNYSTSPATQQSMQTNQEPTQTAQRYVGGGVSSQKTNQSEEARAKQVWASADKLAGTPGYEGKTADQIREAAHNYASDIRSGKVNFDTGSNSAGGGNVSNSNQNNPATGTSQTAGQTAQTPQAATAQPATVDAGSQAALDIINNSTWDEGTKALLRQSVSMWNQGDEVNFDNIEKTFTQIKNTTISPYFQELSTKAIDEAKRAAANIQQARDLEISQEKVGNESNVRNAQNDLESRGLTFSGEGVKQLGAQSAYARPEQGQTAIPTQTAFGGKYAEGLVNQGNKLMSSSSQARYQDNLTNISRNLEQQLGSAASSGIIAGVDQLGNVKESAYLPSQQKQAEASTLTSLYNQESQNIQARKPIEPFK